MTFLRALVVGCLLWSATSASAEEGRKILMVVTSHDRIDEAHPTGLWLEEFAVPYELFTAAGHAVTVASPKGGAAPLDPRSAGDAGRFAPETMAALQDTVPLATLDPAGFDAVFVPGGHGTMFDFPNDPAVVRTVSHAIAVDAPLALVCHGPAALVGAMKPDGSPAAAGRRVTGFTNAEEDAVELTDQMPFLLETKLAEQGATFVGAANFTEHVVVDGNLVTGQNPASSAATARALLERLAAAP